MKRLKPAESYTHTHTCSLLLSLKQIGTICFAFVFSIFSINVFATGIDANASSASCDNPTLGTYSGTSNLQANWQANKIDLFWYSDDTQITDVQNAATSCNYDSGLTVPSTTPTKTGYTFNGWKVRGLPDGYTRLQYIQSTGTQYIDTGLKANLNTKVSLIFKWTEYDSSNKFGYLFGGRDGQSSNAFIVGSSNGFVTTGANFFAQFDSVSPTTVVTRSLDLNKHILLLSSSGFYIDDVLLRTFSGPGTFTTTKTVPLFAYWSGSSLNKGKAAIYSFKMWNGDTLVRDFIPAKNSSNVIGMYDTVSKTFFTNAGSGTFTAGPVVQ